MPERELGVVQAEQVQYRRLHVMDLDRIFGDEKPELVNLSNGLAGLDAASGEPHGEVLDVVVAAGQFLDLAHGGPAELAAPDHQRVVQQAALLEIGDQRCRGPVHVQGDLVQLVGEVVDAVAVVVPAGVIELHEARAALQEAAGDQAIVGEGRLARLGSIEV